MSDESLIHICPSNHNPETAMSRVDLPEISNSQSSNSSAISDQSNRTNTRLDSSKSKTLAKSASVSNSKTCSSVSTVASSNYSEPVSTSSDIIVRSESTSGSTVSLRKRSKGSLNKESVSTYRSSKSLRDRPTTSRPSTAHRSSRSGCPDGIERPKTSMSVSKSEHSSRRTISQSMSSSTSSSIHSIHSSKSSRSEVSTRSTRSSTVCTAASSVRTNMSDMSDINSAISGVKDDRWSNRCCIGEDDGGEDGRNYTEEHPQLETSVLDNDQCEEDDEITILAPDDADINSKFIDDKDIDLALLDKLSGNKSTQAHVTFDKDCQHVEKDVSVKPKPQHHMFLGIRNNEDHAKRHVSFSPSTQINRHKKSMAGGSEYHPTRVSPGSHSTKAVNLQSIRKSSGPGDTPVRDSIPSVPSNSTSRPDWYTDLNNRQVSMFREVFDMLDRDGGGSLNAKELYSVMKEFEIEVSLEEIQRVLGDLDGDGNGEIDFDEFLYAMSETDRYLNLLSTNPEQAAQVREARDGGSSRFNPRQTLFFTAIASFAIKNSMGEVEKYYASKVRHAPHVISCYTAGARLIGLNDRQLERQLRLMQKAAKNEKSPYAKPLPFVTVDRKKDRKASSASGGNNKGNNLNTRHELAAKGSVVARIPQIRNKLESGDVTEPLCSSLRKRRRTLNKDQETIETNKKTGSKLGKKTHGWVIPRVEWGKSPLPFIKVAPRKGKPFTIEDVADIRKRVSGALDSYYDSLRVSLVQRTREHWSQLHIKEIRSEKLTSMFRTVFRSYSPHKVEEVFPICPWIPGPRFTSRQASKTGVSMLSRSPTCHASKQGDIPTRHVHSAAAVSSKNIIAGVAPSPTRGISSARPFTTRPTSVSHGAVGNCGFSHRVYTQCVSPQPHAKSARPFTNSSYLPRPPSRQIHTPTKIY